MIIRCPQCEHSRSISESKIPPGAELATCPKCKHRFRFRTLRPALDAPEPPAPPKSPAAPVQPASPAPPVLRPQEAFREAAEQNDIWDAMDALHQRWEAQMDQHVTEVETPRPLSAEESGEQAAAPPEREPAATGLAESSAEAPMPPMPAVPPEKSVPDGPAQEAKAPSPAAQPGPPEPEKTAPEARTPIAFLYAEDGPAPEERVEQDMRMLLDSPSSGPLRDLGRLREFPDSAGDAEGGAAAAHNQDVPWENASELGWFSAFAATVRGAMFGGPPFFAAFTGSGSLTPGYLFFVMLGYISILGALAWSLAAEALLPGLLPRFTERVSLPLLLLLAPVALGLMQLFVTGWIRLALRLVAPEKADFGLVYKVVSYSVAPFVLSIVPFIGPPLGALWFLAALIIGCRGGFGLSRPLAVIVPLPPALLLLGGLAWYFL